MTIYVSATQRFGPGQQTTINDPYGVLITSTTASFNNAGTINVVATGDRIAGLAFDYAGFFETSVFTNEATGILRVNLTEAAFFGGIAFGVHGPSGWNGDVVNAGLIEVLSVSHATGIHTSDRTFILNNTGTLRVRAVEEGTGVYVFNGATLSNAGTIDVQGRTAIGMSVLAASTITNGGTIIARAVGSDSTSIALKLWNSSIDETRITNTGRIEGRYAIVDATDGSPPQNSRQAIDNSGTIVGIIDLARGDDDLINSGTIQGEVRLGLGADRYDGAAGSITGAVHGGFGNDRLTGGAAVDYLYGEDGDDEIHAGGGNDVLQGGRGSNILDGGAGDDTLTYSGLTIGVDLDLALGTATAAGRDQIISVENVHGSRWADQLRGDGGANTLFGADGDDRLDGRDGADILAGGLGNDTLTGGGGADRFIYGRGDGADTITDLGAGDMLVIHQYSAWRELRQVGADTLVILSDTDSILLTGVSTADAQARITFNAQARPTYGLPFEAPDTFGSSTILLDSRFVIHDGETVRFDNVVGPTGPLGPVRSLGPIGVYAGIDAIDPGVTNAGRIAVTDTTSNGASGVVLWGVGASTEFLNQTTGRLEVTSTAAGAAAMAVGSLGWHSIITNEGLIDVRSAGTAYGVQGTGESIDLLFTNSGTMRVQGVGTVWGAQLGVYGSLNNTGTIEVIGSGNVTGVYSYQYAEIVNDGLIRVTNTSGTSIGVQATGNVVRITNTGRIEADRAVQLSGSYVSELHNSGDILGSVMGGFSNDTVINTGRITGTVSLGGFNDIYDGSRGVQEGLVDGGEGQDRIIGGAGNDHLGGGAGSDTLIGGLGDDRLEGGENDDYAIFSGPRSAYSWTTVGDSVVITGPDGTDTLIGVELLQFSDQLVSLTGYGLRDSGSGGDDVLEGTSLNDILDGGQVTPLDWANGRIHDGADRISGYGGNDILSGGTMNDVLDGGDGDDLLDGGMNNDTLIGGAGIDTARYIGPRSLYLITAVDGVTTVHGPDGRHPVNNEQIFGYDTLTGIERLLFDDGLYDIAGNPLVNEVFGTDAGDALTGTGGVDRISGGAGNDTISGSAGHDVIDGGAGDDMLVVTFWREDARLVVLGDGEFLLKGPGGGSTLTGVEVIRFAGGRTIDLRMQYGPDGWGAFVDGDGDQPQVLPADDHLPLPGDPLVLPGLADKGFGDEPLVLPGAGAPGGRFAFAADESGLVVMGPHGPMLLDIDLLHAGGSHDPWA